jgi:SulP family sulfate permease
MMPSAGDAKKPVVVLRLRGHAQFGATLVEVLANYADELRNADGRLYLSGIGKNVEEQIVRTGKLRLAGPVRIFAATTVRGESTEEAYADAKEWLLTSVPGETETAEMSEKRGHSKD